MTKLTKKLDWNGLQEIYPYSTHYVANLEVDNFLNGKTHRYAVVHEKSGEKTSSGRTVYEANQIYYKRNSNGFYEKTESPYK